MAYSEKVLDHYDNPRNVGSFDKEAENVGTGMVGAPACGDVMKLQIRVGKNGVIEDARFKTYGCGSAIASSSLVTELIKGKTLNQALAIKNMDIVSELALPPVKIHCSILAEDAIRAAVADYQKRRQARQERQGDDADSSAAEPKGPTEGAQPVAAPAACDQARYHIYDIYGNGHYADRRSGAARAKIFIAARQRLGNTFRRAHNRMLRIGVHA